MTGHVAIENADEFAGDIVATQGHRLFAVDNSRSLGSNMPMLASLDSRQTASALPQLQTDREQTCRRPKT